jgi:hypothetical protein
MVTIIRHGEKPGNPGNEKEGGPDLSMLGSARAAALPSLFSPDPDGSPVEGLTQWSCQFGSGHPKHFAGRYTTTTVAAGNPKYATPNYLFATQKSSRSNRPRETITPLSEYLIALNDPSFDGTIDDTISDNDYKQVAKTILNNPAKYGGKVILICWHHGKAPDLAAEFKVPDDQLKPWKPWKATVFDLVFQITWINGNANLNVNYQALLFNDTPMKQSDIP